MTGVRRFAQWGLWFGGALVLLAAILIGIDVLMRKFLARSIGGADELAGYSLAIGTAWGLGAALARPRPYPHRLALRAVSRRSCASRSISPALVLFVAFFALIAWHGLGVVSQSWTSGSRSQSALETPTVIPQVLWIVGPRGFRRRRRRPAGRGRSGSAASGDLRAWRKLISTRSAEEEVEDEIRDLQDRQDAKGALTCSSSRSRS